MTAAMLIKNGGGFINLGHWVVVVGGGGCGYQLFCSIGWTGGDRTASFVLITQVIWAIVEHISIGGQRKTAINNNNKSLEHIKSGRLWPSTKIQIQETSKQDNIMNNRV